MTEDDLLKHEENIAKVLDRIVSLCKQTGLTDLAEKGEQVLKYYSKSKKLR
ncbi:MAG: hypothetical protein ACFE8M_08450 [Candidatus Hermodarchaeota archaeon]